MLLTRGASLLQIIGHQTVFTRRIITQKDKMKSKIYLDIPPSNYHTSHTLNESIRAIYTHFRERLKKICKFSMAFAMKRVGVSHSIKVFFKNVFL